MLWLLAVGIPQHPDQHRPQGPVLLQQFGEGRLAG
jgi:hypothetical protein